MAFQAWHGLSRDGLVGPATRTALETAAVPKPTIASGRRIELYRQKGVVLLIADGKVVRAIHTSTGKPGFGTPAGQYKIYRRSARDWSYPFQVWLPSASYFTGGYAFHAYADVPATPASHGSARIPTPEADAVFAFARRRHRRQRLLASRPGGVAAPAVTPPGLLRGDARSARWPSPRRRTSAATRERRGR